MTTKTKLRISGVLLFVSAFSVLWVITSFIGVPIFIAKFQVTNNTSKTIKLTPFGQWEGSKVLGTLPIYAIPFPSVQSPFITNLTLNSKETKEIWFDSDDCKLCGFIILDPIGQFKIMPASMEDSINSFFISDSTTMKFAEPELIQITNYTHYVRYVSLHLVLLIGLVNMPCFFYFLIKRIRDK